MKDESPRIFRSLETSAGRAEFDTIVGAAVASYGALRNPSEHQARDFGRLVLPLWHRISADTKRTLAAALSASSRVPRPIVERIIAEPLEIAAPFLMSSPVLTDLDRMLLAKSRDRRLRKLLATRDRPAAMLAGAEPVPPTQTARHPAGREMRAAGDVPAGTVLTDSPVSAHPLAVTTSNDSEPPVEAPAAEAAVAAPRHATAADVRATLRGLVLPGRRPAARTSPATVADLVALAVQQDHGSFGTALASMLDLGEAPLEQIDGDASGERLAVALKALDVGAADALTILMMLKPAIGLDVRAFDLMGRYYRSLRTEDCATLVGRTSRRALSPPLQPQYQDFETVPRQAPRKDFGRRQARPLPSQIVSRSR